MPDMSKPCAHIEDFLTAIRCRAQDCRRRVADLNTQMRLYDDLAIEIEMVLMAETKKLGAMGKTAEESK